MDSEVKSPEIEPAIEEVRVAMALNGGVSLAVWMGGCAVELDCARRARLGPEQMAFDGYDPAKAGTTRERRVYSAILKALGRRFSVDILSGVSAGGINGALMGAAMVSDRRLHPKFIRDQWLALGDLDGLLRDPKEDAPSALMDGELFHRELLRAFRAVRGEPGAGDTAPTAEMLAAAALPKSQREEGSAQLVPFLDVTMTNTIGSERRFADEWGQTLVARAHDPRFAFRRKEDYESQALADAARASASFPLAFEPLPLSVERGSLAGLDAATYAIDGGLLDNAPIRAALDLIPLRRAGTRVRRYACYLNADPTEPQPAADSPPSPEVADVIGYMVNLPRAAPFVHQLYALKAATNRPPVTRVVVDQLLHMDLSALRATADALLPAYQRRRTTQSLEELLIDPAAADAERDIVEPDGAGLSWIPSGSAVEPPAESEWQWGIRPAQRILFLLLDLLREDLGDAAAGGDRAQGLLAQRATLEGRIGQLERMHDDVTAQNEGDIAGLSEAIAGRAGEIYGLLAESAGEFAGRLPDPPGRDAFFVRMLAIEVVRRSLGEDANVDSGQRLRFVQLTPESSTPILASRPLSNPAAAGSARGKLLGVDLGHFAGFYRRAWRANDFMWGRLDAANRIVDLLLDEPPEPEGADREAAALARAAALAQAVLDPGVEPGSIECELVQEALADSWRRVPPASETTIEPGALRVLLAAAIAEELDGANPTAPTGPSDGRALRFTRAVLTRAIQLEILRDELPVLIEEAKGDGALGSSGMPLEIDQGKGIAAMIAALRELEEQPGDSLKARLTGRSEATSPLGMATIARAAGVGVRMAEPALPPFSKAVVALRPFAALIARLAPQKGWRRALSIALFAAAGVAVLILLALIAAALFVVLGAAVLGGIVVGAILIVAAAVVVACRRLLGRRRRS